MSIFGDYKAYKKYEPSYSHWKHERSLADAKRQEYFKQNPDKIDSNDIQKGKVLLRAIDIMDEYSQKRAEDMEMAVENIIGFGMDAVIFAGTAVGGFIGNLKPVKNFLKKQFGANKQSKLIGKIIPFGAGALAGMIAAFPLFNLSAKAEVAASRHGRFEAMRKDLSNPNGFAILTDKQIQEVNEIVPNISLKEKKNKMFNFSGLDTLRSLTTESKQYEAQKKAFELELMESEKHINDKMTDSEIENAKKDQQLLTRLVEKIDIASQDYAENAELATQAGQAFLLGFGALFNILLGKVLNAMNIKSQPKIMAISQSLGVIIPIAFSVFAAGIQKEASRVGRFKVKQDLLKNPQKLAYVADEKIADKDNVEVHPEKKENIFKFLIDAYKSTKEYNTYKKTKGKEEEKFFKAANSIELTPEQLKNAKTLQRNTFKTFNKIDEKSQQYSESIEALGQAASFPISLISMFIGFAVGTRYLTKGANSNSKIEMISNISKYFGAVLVSVIPSIIINSFITKEQKKASRIADMLAINEMSDYRKFR